MDENTLIDKSLAGDKEAMDALVNLHWDRVYHHCLRIVHDEQIAQDLSQETFIHAFAHLAAFQRRAKLSTWLWRIAHNISLRHLKKQQHTHPLIEEILEAPETPQESEFFAHLQKALDTLDEKHRQVFELYDLEHIPQKEIAAKLGVPHGTVRSRLHYARQKVREYFKKFPLEV